jgi:hypothetical protein
MDGRWAAQRETGDGRRASWTASIARVRASGTHVMAVGLKRCGGLLCLLWNCVAFPSAGSRLHIARQPQCRRCWPAKHNLGSLYTKRHNAAAARCGIDSPAPIAGQCANPLFSVDDTPFLCCCCQEQCRGSTQGLGPHAPHRSCLPNCFSASNLID